MWLPPLSGGGEFRTGRTPYESLTVNLKITHGVANVEDVHMEGPAVALAMSGTASIPARELDLKGTASLMSNSTSSFYLPFVVQGPWDDPLIFPDPESLIRRSPASAPLLEAIKDKKTQDAVRSVIERFTGGGLRPAAAPDTSAPEPAAPAAAEAAKPN